jgi:hypothetical protein
MIMQDKQLPYTSTAGPYVSVSVSEQKKCYLSLLLAQKQERVRLWQPEITRLIEALQTALQLLDDQPQPDKPGEEKE